LNDGPSKGSVPSSGCSSLEAILFPVILPFIVFAEAELSLPSGPLELTDDYIVLDCGVVKYGEKWALENEEARPNAVRNRKVSMFFSDS
jgi:hypothetical protein